MWLTIYACNAWVMTMLFLKHRRDIVPPLEPPMEAATWPSVTVQLPIFNEALVVERLIDAVAKLEYPAQRFQIQVLDDSTDETTQLAAARVEQYRQQGVNIELVHRRYRPGFKAGALRQALTQASGQFIAIFDADFVPEPDFLLKTIPHFASHSRLGFVQTRWGHLNRDYSLLTAAQALALDGHFVVEQTARNRSGLMMNFNGTAGVWRRACIEAAGGWQADTISEDFDLSYRAQLAGWHCLFLPEVVAPAEIPPQLAAFKRQQFRWAKGSIQCLKKLGWPVVRSDFNAWVKLQALIHLSSYSLHPLMLILALIIPVFMLNDGSANIRFPLFYLSLLSFGPPLLFAITQISLDAKQWRRRYRAMPLLILLGSGIALSNSKAFIEAILGTGNVFRRTPKFNVVSTGDVWQQSNYRLPLDWLVLGEIGLSLYSLLGAGLAALNGHYFAVPFILMYAFGFGYVGLQGIWDARFEWWGWFRLRLRRSSQTTKASHPEPVGIKR
ncbi:MAG: glycosyltransferase [Anaerolineae bacterium]|nr:glycosyltransferase [Anaerolineae bacterium]